MGRSDGQSLFCSVQSGKESATIKCDQLAIEERAPAIGGWLATTLDDQRAMNVNMNVNMKIRCCYQLLSSLSTNMSML